MNTSKISEKGNYLRKKSEEMESSTLLKYKNSKDLLQMTPRSAEFS